MKDQLSNELEIKFVEIDSNLADLNSRILCMESSADSSSLDESSRQEIFSEIDMRRKCAKNFIVYNIENGADAKVDLKNDTENYILLKMYRNL